MPHRKSAPTNRSANSWPVTRRWIATGTLAVYTAIGCYKLTAAQLPLLGAGSIAPQLKAPLPAYHIDIPAGLLEDAVRILSKTANLNISMSSEGIGKLSTVAVSGLLTPEQALDQMLKNTGVRFRFIGPGTVLLDLNTVATTVDVASSGSSLPTSIAKYSELIRDTPQTINVVGQKVMEEQNVTTLREALRNVAGISIAAGEAGAQGDNMTIRGFSARNDLYIDGMRDFGSYYRDPFNLEEVAVIQGPASSTFGRGSTGGVVNQATKFPTLTRAFSGTFDGGTDGTRRATGDINLPFKALGKAASFRLNVMGTEGGVAGRDVAHNRRYGVAPSLAFGQGTPTRVTLSVLHQQADDTPDYGIPWLFNQPAPVERHNYYRFRDGNYLRTNDNIATLREEHDFNGHFSLRNQTRYARYRRDVLITEPQIFGTVTLATPLSAILINRNQLGNNSLEAFFANQTDATMNIETGKVRHTLITGLELDREDSDPTRPRYTGVPTTSLLSPDINQAFAGIPVINTIVRARSNSIAAYVIDTAKFGPHWELSGSFRFDRFNSHYTQAVPPAVAFNRLDHLPSWRCALVYKPIVPLSIYASAGNSFNPSAESLSLAANSANLPPEENRTYEVGAKWDLANPGLSLRTALFRTDKLNAREPDPTNALLNVLAGKQKVQGVQADVSGHITSRWDAQIGYAYLDATVVSSNFYPAAVGARLANVPRHTFNMWNTYQLPWKTRIGAGGNFVGSRTSSSTVPFEPITGLVKQAPGYWVFNAMVERPFGEHTILHANVNNLADRYYYDQLHPSHIILGPALVALVGIRFRF